MKKEIIDNILFKLASSPHIETKEDFHKFKNDIYKDYKIERGISSIELLERYRELTSI